MLNNFNLGNWKVTPSSIKEKSTRGLDLARRLLENVSIPRHYVNQLNN